MKMVGHVFGCAMRALGTGVLVMSVVSGCATGPSAAGMPRTIATSAEPASALVGQLVTVTAQTDVPVSQRATIDWITTNGTLTTEREATTARVRFDKPGTFRVTAKLMVDSIESARSAVEVVVKPVE